MADLATPMALRVAATLRLADHVGDTGATPADLAAKTGTNAPALHLLLDHLVTVGVFALDAETSRYHVTELGDELRDDELRADLDMTSAIGRADLAFVELLGTITTGEAAYPKRYGRDFWADLEATPALRRSFDAKMSRRFQVQAQQIAERFEWARFPDIVDVGGGDGTLLTAVLQAHPGCRGRALDLPPTAARAEERFRAARLDGRATALPGSFFDPLPAGANAYVLSDILHGWDDDHARSILAGCATAATPNGTVLVIEPVRGESADTAIDLSMLVFFGGQERSADELARLAAEHGLELRDTRRVADHRTLLEFGRRA